MRAMPVRTVLPMSPRMATAHRCRRRSPSPCRHRRSGWAPTTIPVPQVGAPYSTSVTAAGGTAPYHFLVSGGAVPAGLALNGSTGAISGTPTAGGNASFKVTATDSSVGSGPFSGSQTYLVTVSPPNIGISPATLPNVQQGGAYSETITASGGTAPYRFTVSSGALPGGLVLDPSSGVISGTPSAGATASFTVAVSDSSSGTGPFVATRTYTLLVQGPVPTPPAAGPLSATTACDTPASINLALGISGAAVTPGRDSGRPWPRHRPAQRRGRALHAELGLLQRPGQLHLHSDQCGRHIGAGGR
ncbi:MAG: Ig domain-containing protein [Aliidongia sp.]